MRAIIIEEERFAEICVAMKHEVEAIAARTDYAENAGVSKEAWKAACDDIHRSMHFHFVRWAQSHGASCVPK